MTDFLDRFFDIFLKKIFDRFFWIHRFFDKFNLKKFLEDFLTVFLKDSFSVHYFGIFWKIFDIFFDRFLGQFIKISNENKIYLRLIGELCVWFFEVLRYFDPDQIFRRIMNQ